MSNQFEAILDVTGVEGAAFVDLTNKVIARQMPTLYSDELLAGIYNRGKSINAAMGSSLPGSNRVLLKFMHKSVYIRIGNGGALVVIGTPSMSQSGLTVASHILLSNGITPETTAEVEAPSNTPQQPTQQRAPATAPPAGKGLPPTLKPSKKTRSGIWG